MLPVSPDGHEIVWVCDVAVHVTAAAHVSMPPAPTVTALPTLHVERSVAVRLVAVVLPKVTVLLDAVRLPVLILNPFEN